MQVDEVVTAYTQAIADEDRVRASRLLESLEGDHYANEPDWERIRVFCVAQGFDARLEIITKRLIKRGGAASGAPFLTLAGLLMKSGRVEEAKPLVAQYRQISDSRDGGQWELVNLLFDVEEFQEALDVIEKVLSDTPDSFPFLISEPKALWYLGQRKAARVKHRALEVHLGTDAGRWLWYSTMALELEEELLARNAVRRLIEMLWAGQMKLTPGVMFALKEAGHFDDLKRLLGAADPANYLGLDERLALFDAAIAYGLHEPALRFGRAILAVEPEHRLRRQIEQLYDGPAFLMS